MSTTEGAAVNADRTCSRVMTTHRHTTMKGRAKVTVLVPAHNEAQDIGATIKSIQGQSRPPDEIVVMCRRCRWRWRCNRSHRLHDRDRSAVFDRASHGPAYSARRALTLHSAQGKVV